MSTSIKEEVQRRYGQHARTVTENSRVTGGCGSDAVACCDPVTSNLYGTDEASQLPTEAVLA